MMTGQSASLNGKAAAPVMQLQMLIAERLGVPANKQRLLLRGTTLDPAQQLATYGVQSGDILHLVEQLYSTKGSLIKRINFDLSWGFPGSGADYLDGTCFLYSGTVFHSHVDYRQKVAGGIQHSGDVMHQTGGKHTMRFEMSKVDPHVDRLFFVLSAYNCDSLALFRNPAVALTNGDTGEPLSEYTIASAGNSQGVVMCCASRVRDGGTGDYWSVDKIGRQSPGNAKAYGPLQATCAQLAQQM